MKKAITILAICSLLLTACGQIDDTESKPVTTTTTVTESSADADTTEASSAKEEKDTSEATTMAKKSSQTVSGTSKPTGTTVTTIKKTGSSNANGDSNQGKNNSVQNNNGQENNDQPEQNNHQLDNSPSDNDQSNNDAEQNNRPTENKHQNDEPSPPVTTAKPVVTNLPATTTPKSQTTIPQTEPPSPEPDDQVVDTDALTDQVWVFIEYYPIEFNNMYEKGKTFGGSDFDKAVSILEYANDLGGRNCIEYALNAYFLYQGAGLECGITFASLDEWYGHVANVVKIDGTWYEFDASARKYTENLYFVVKAFDIYENEIIVK